MFACKSENYLNTCTNMNTITQGISFAILIPLPADTERTEFVACGGEESGRDRILMLNFYFKGTRHVKTHETLCPNEYPNHVYKSLILPYLGYCCLHGMGQL